MATATATVRVLNASFEELGSTKLGRAVALVSSGKAVVEEADTFKVLRSVNGSQLPFPRVIRLLNYLRVPIIYSAENWSKAGVLRRDGHKCGYCGKKANTLDHIIPQSRFEGNPHTWENSVAACQRCNGKKDNLLLSECGMVLLVKPYTPMRMYLRSGKKPSRR